MADDDEKWDNEDIKAWKGNDDSVEYALGRQKYH